MKNKRKQQARWVAQWRASGLSSEAFGGRLGVTGRCVRRWEKKLRDEGRRRPRLVRVEVVPATVPEQPVVVNVAGRRVEVLSGFSKSTLAAVLAVVEEEQR